MKTNKWTYNRWKKWSIALMMLLMQHYMLAADMYVTTTGAGTKDGSSWENASDRLDLIVYNAPAGTVIHIGAGTYVSQISAAGQQGEWAAARTFPVKAGITLIGGYPAQGGDTPDRENNPTVLSGNNTLQNFVTITSAGAPSVFENLIFSNSANSDYGAFKSTVTGAVVVINNSSFQNNLGRKGAGIHMTNGTLSITNTNFYNNTNNSAQGGAIYLANVVASLDNVRMLDNSAQSGGAIYISGGQLAVSNSVVSRNAVNGTGTGGAIYATNVDPIVMTHVTIADNQAQHGGSGIYVENSNLNLLHCSIAENINTGWGGGGVAGSGSNIDISHSIITGNITKGNGEDIPPGGSVSVDTSVIGNDIYLADGDLPIEGGFDPDTLYVNDDGEVVIEVPETITVDGEEIPNPVLDESMGADPLAGNNIILKIYSEDSAVCVNSTIIITIAKIKGNNINNFDIGYKQNNNDVIIQSTSNTANQFTVDVDLTGINEVVLNLFTRVLANSGKYVYSNVLEIPLLPFLYEDKLQHVKNTGNE